MAEKDIDFKKALMESEILLPDGHAISVSTRLLTGRRVKKIAGSDLHDYLLAYLNKKEGRCFYLGSSVETLKKIQDRIKKEYPAVKAGFYSPPFKASFTKEESKVMIERANAFQAEVLFIGMTAPKQEKWAFQFKYALQADVICCIGAVFDFYAGTVKRPSQVWINLGLEWLGRFIKEPGRLWKRYIYYGPIYIFYILREKTKTFWQV